DVGARTGTLTIMVGGEQADFEAMRPVFACMGNKMHWMGGPGSGQHTKMANQIAIAGALAGVCEAVTYAKGAALDPGAVLDAIGGGAAGSWQLRYNGAKMIASDRSAGFYIKHYIKDLRIALEASQAFCGGLEVEPLVLSMFESLAAQGMDEDGTQSLIYHYLPMDDA
ncbi:MAG: NAD(P)-dependent oxidoreductase, partial [Clostridia bacterium]